MDHHGGAVAIEHPRQHFVARCGQRGADGAGAAAADSRVGKVTEVRAGRILAAVLVVGGIEMAAGGCELGRPDRLRRAYADLSASGIRRTATATAASPIGTTASVAITPLARLPVRSEMNPAVNGPSASPSSVAPRK